MAKQPTKALPRALPLLTGLTTGVFAAFAVEVQLTAMGMPVTTAWAQLTSGAPLRFTSASVLWALAGTAFVVGAATAGLLVRFPPPWRNFRTLRWIIGAAITFGLAYVAHGAGAPHDVAASSALVGDMAAIGIAAVMALLGASFARAR
jgi:hypothetical protein